MITDVNVNLSRWPFRRTPCDQLPRLVQTLRKHGVLQAWVGSLDGLFHRDIGGVNLRLVEACRSQRDVQLIPFGSVNPTLPDWREDLRRCAEDHRMPGIRLHPNYHGYGLAEPIAGELLDEAADRRLIVQLVVRMDDVRVQHPLMQVRDVDTSPLAEMVAARPTLHVLVLNALATLRGDDLKRLASVERIGFEIAMKEGVGGVANLLRDVPLSQVFFGSHLPLFPVESAMLKLQESALDERHRETICFGNARRWLQEVSRTR